MNWPALNRRAAGPLPDLAPQQSEVFGRFSRGCCCRRPRRIFGPVASWIHVVGAYVTLSMQSVSAVMSRPEI